MKLAFFFLPLALLFAGTHAFAATATIDIAVEDSADPWSMRDGTGFANDVVVEAFKAVGIDAKLNVMPYARCKMEVERGTVVACFSMSWDPSFKDTVIFSDKPILSCRADYYYNLKRPVKFKKESDITRGTSIGIVNGYEYPKSFNSLVAKGIKSVSSVDEQVLLKKLALGRVDLVIINHNDVKSIERMIENAGVSNQVAYAFPSGILESFIGFSKKNPHGAWARQKFDEGYKVIINNGTYHELELKWIRKLAEEILMQDGAG